MVGDKHGKLVETRRRRFVDKIGSVVPSLVSDILVYMNPSISDLEKLKVREIIMYLDINRILMEKKYRYTPSLCLDTISQTIF